nr:MAG TPA: hypothetical protein [Caudoviricetes sp.]
MFRRRCQNINIDRAFNITLIIGRKIIICAAADAGPSSGGPG